MCEQQPTTTARTELHTAWSHFITRTRVAQELHSSGLHIFVSFKNNCHLRVLSHSFLPHLTLTTSTSSLSSISSTSPFFPTVSPLQTNPMIIDPYFPCDVPRQSGGSTQIPSVTKCAHWVLWKFRIVQKDFLKDICYSSDWEQMKINMERTLTSTKVGGTALQIWQCLISEKVDILSFEEQVRWTEDLWKSKKGGKLSVHYEGDWSTAELFFSHYHFRQPAQCQRRQSLIREIQISDH